jgi:hypothetical protein
VASITRSSTSKLYMEAGGEDEQMGEPKSESASSQSVKGTEAPCNIAEADAEAYRVKGTGFVACVARDDVGELGTGHVRVAVSAAHLVADVDVPIEVWGAARTVGMFMPSILVHSILPETIDDLAALALASAWSLARCSLIRAREASFL